MAFNKNRKRAIGIIASYLFGLSSSSGVFKDHEVSYCNTHEKIFHHEAGEKCCDNGDIEKLSCNAYQQCDHFVNGLHFFKRGNKIFYCLVRKKGSGNKYEFVYNSSFSNGKDFAKELKQFDKTLFTEQELKGWETQIKDDHTRNFFKFLIDCYQQASMYEGTIKWDSVQNDNPLDFCAIHISSAESFAKRLGKKTAKVKLIECFSKEDKNENTDKWYINHGTDKKYDILLSNEELKKKDMLPSTFWDILGYQGNTGDFDRKVLRNNNFVFFYLNHNEDRPTLLRDTKTQFYIKKINRIPLMYVSRDCVGDGRTSDLPLNLEEDLPILFGDGLGVLKEISKKCQTIDDVAKILQTGFDKNRVEVRIPAPIYTLGHGAWGN